MKKNLAKHEQQAFTLIELMITVVIIAVLASIAIPSYQEYIRKSEAAKATQAMMNLSQELERHKARNFNYLGFKSGASAYAVADTSYSITIVDGSSAHPKLTQTTAVGQSWVMKANANDSYGKKYNFVLSSNGIKCRNKTYAVMTFDTCGTGQIEGW